MIAAIVGAATAASVAPVITSNVVEMVQQGANLDEVAALFMHCGADVHTAVLNVPSMGLRYSLNGPWMFPECSPKDVP
jgi:hypothetical protein